jgi:hypothetical protein
VVVSVVVVRERMRHGELRYRGCRVLVEVVIGGEIAGSRVYVVELGILCLVEMARQSMAMLTETRYAVAEIRLFDLAMLVA